MLLSAGTTIGRTPTRPLPGPLLRCCFLQVRPSVVPPTDHCPGCCSDAALHRYDHRSYPQQTTARAAAQILLSSGTTIGRTVPPTDHCPGCCSDAALHRYDHRSYPQQTTARAAAQILLSSGTTIGRTTGRPPPRPLLRCCFLQVRPSVVPPADRRPGRCSDTAFLRYDHRSYPRQTTARAAA